MRYENNENQRSEFDYSTLYRGRGASGNGCRRGVSEQERFEQELEQQIGQMGRDLGNAARDIGYTVLGAVGEGVSFARERVSEAARAQRSGQRPNVFAQMAEIFADRDNELERVGKKRWGIGLAQMITFGVLAFGLGLSGLICVAVAAYEHGIDQDIAAIIGGSLILSAAPCGALFGIGLRNIRDARKMRHYAALIDQREWIALDELANGTGQTVAAVLQDLHRWQQKGWLRAWVDEEMQAVFFDLDLWRTAQQTMQQAYAARAAARYEQPEPASTMKKTAETEPVIIKKVPEAETPAAGEDTVAAMERFSVELNAERARMDDPLAAEELDKLCVTTRAILDWLRAHPESGASLTRMTDYYMPTTIKLLRTYNEVHAQPGKNAEAIRRDIAGILHTLNLAFENLYNSMLSAVALDVSGEIAALQGMMAQDGLAQNGLAGDVFEER